MPRTLLFRRRVACAPCPVASVAPRRHRPLPPSTQTISVPLCLPLCLPASVPTCLCACLPICLPLCLPLCLHLCLPTRLPQCLPLPQTVLLRLAHRCLTHTLPHPLSLSLSTRVTLFAATTHPQMPQTLELPNLPACLQRSFLAASHPITSSWCP